jgi:hypothetical protein
VLQQDQNHPCEAPATQMTIYVAHTWEPPGVTYVHASVYEHGRV